MQWKFEKRYLPHLFIPNQLDLANLNLNFHWRWVSRETIKWNLIYFSLFLQWISLSVYILVEGTHNFIAKVSAFRSRPISFAVHFYLIFSSWKTLNYNLVNSRFVANRTITSHNWFLPNVSVVHLYGFAFTLNFILTTYSRSRSVNSRDAEHFIQLNAKAWMSHGVQIWVATSRSLGHYGGNHTCKWSDGRCIAKNA